MSLVLFLRQLAERSHVEVGAFESGEGDLAEAESTLQEMAEQLRLELAFDPPALSVRPAVWAAQRLYRGAQFLVFREEGPDSLEKALHATCPEAPSPSVCFSVDLSFRFLPDLVRLARAVARDDPLVLALMRLAREWPLSSVGVPEVGPVDTGPFWNDPCLRQLCVDRIIARGDAGRLTDPRVRDALKAAVGLYPELAGGLANNLEESMTL
jgi:hypothetical protein